MTPSDRRPPVDKKSRQAIMTCTPFTINILKKLSESNHLEFKEARFRLNGKTIVIKPRTTLTAS